MATEQDIQETKPELEESPNKLLKKEEPVGIEEQFGTWEDWSDYGEQLFVYEPFTLTRAIGEYEVGTKFHSAAFDYGRSEVSLRTGKFEVKYRIECSLKEIDRRELAENEL